MKKAGTRLYTMVALGTIAAVGLLEGTRGVVLPGFLQTLSLDPAEGARVFAASSIGTLGTSLLFGTLTGRLGLKRVGRLGLLTGAVTLALFLTLRSQWLLLAVNALLGAGLSMVEMSSDLPVSLLYGEKQSGMLNLLHGCFGGGALLGSLWAAVWLGLGASWHVAFGTAAGAIVLWGLVYQALPEIPLPRAENNAPVGYGPLFRDPLVWAAAFALFAAVVGEAGLSLWLPSYLQAAKGMAPAASAVRLSLFYAGFTVMRLTGGWAIRWAGEVRAIIGLALLGAGSLFLLLWLPGGFSWLAVPAGMGVAIGFATCTALVATRYPDRVNQVYTVMYSAGGLAGILTGPLMGWIAQTSGYTAAMTVVLGAYVVQALLVGYYGWAQNRQASGRLTDRRLA